MTRTVTMLLRRWRDGDAAAADELIALVYGELHRIASRSLRTDRERRVLRPTELIGEAYERLARGAQPEWNDRAHFFAIAARVMRQILVDHLRRQDAAKRGGDERPITFEDQVAGGERPIDVLALHEALEELVVFDERKARALELHYFGGLTHADIAEVLEVHINTVARDVKLAEAWIHRRITT